MKNKKNLFPIFISLSITLAILSGCSGTGNKNSSKTEIEEEYKRGYYVNWVDIPVGDEQSFEDEVVGIIEDYQDMDEGDEDYGLYSGNEIENISKFYSLDKLQLDGYELYSASVSSEVFLFYFAPIEVMQKHTDDIIVDGSFITIQIKRPEQFTVVDRFQDVIEQIEATDKVLEREQSYYLSEDGILYEEEAMLIYAKLDDTIFSIQLISELGRNYEYMRNLVFQVIESASEVNVEESIEKRVSQRSQNNQRQNNNNQGNGNQGRNQNGNNNQQ